MSKEAVGVERENRGKRRVSISASGGEKKTNSRYTSLYWLMGSQDALIPIRLLQDSWQYLLATYLCNQSPVPRFLAVEEARIQLFRGSTISLQGQEISQA